MFEEPAIKLLFMLLIAVTCLAKKNFFSINNKMDQKSQNEINYGNSFFFGHSLFPAVHLQRSKHKQMKRKKVKLITK